MRAPWILSLLICAACRGGSHGTAATPEPPAPRAEAPDPAAATPARRVFIDSAWRLEEHTTPLEVPHAVVVSSHRLASNIGVSVLRQGGNAVDAAVAVGFALAVVHPIAGNIGGGGFMVIRLNDGQVYALDYREVAPARAARDMYVDSDSVRSQASVTGHLAAGVPGSVAGLYEAQRRFGRLPWSQVVTPAIALARDGFTMDVSHSRQIAFQADRLAKFPASRAQFLPNDRAPEPGSRFQQPELARTLQLIADSGPRGFYEGTVADYIVAEMRRGGGLITKADLAAYKPKWRTPIQIGYRGYSIYTMPPPSGGGVALAEILNVMEGYGSLPSFGSAALMHLQAEAMRLAYVDRNTYLGDPDVVDMPLERLLSKSYASELRQGIDPSRATPLPPPPHRAEGMETTHYSVVDSAGNAVSCTTTLNDDFGSAVTVAGAGFILNDEMDDFTSAPGRPNLYGLVQGSANAIAPGKRMLSAMTPSIVVDSQQQLFLVLGSPGGPRITTAVYQVISDVIDQGMSLPEAVAAPRLHAQALPDLLYLERGGFVQETVDSLQAMGHPIMLWPWPYKTEVNAIARSATGWIGVADPRRGGEAVGY